jgi:hypothetical protein
MWCSNCGRDYGEGEVCPNCGTAGTETPKASWGLSSGLDAMHSWPRTESGEPENPAFLTHCGSLGMEDELTVNLLSAYGIPALRHYPNDGNFGRLIIGMSGSGVDLFVPESRLDEAKQLIKGEVL